MKSKKVIKKLRIQLNREVIGLLNEIKTDREQISKLQSLVNSKNGKIDALSNKLGNLKSDVQTIAKHVQNLEAEKEKNCTCHTNTQKTDKNATEWQESGKKEYLETIVTNEMFNDELEKRLSESFIQDHPAFMLLNGFIPSNTIEDLIRAKLKSKGEHYSPNGDRYSNFKRLNGVSFKKKSVPERIENFMEKHEIWIEDYQAGDVSGTLLDLIESCIDVLCYYLLLNIYLKFNGEVKQNRIVSAEDIKSGWKGFILKYANTDFGLSSLKSYVKEVKYSDSKITIIPMSEFIEKGLKDKKADIEKCLKEYYMVNIEVEILALSDGTVIENKVVEKLCNLPEKIDITIDEECLFGQMVAYEDVFPYCKEKLKLTSDFFYSEWAKKIYKVLEEIYTKHSDITQWGDSGCGALYSNDMDASMKDYLSELWGEQLNRHCANNNCDKRALNDAIIGIELRKVERETQFIIQSKDISISNMMKMSELNQKRVWLINALNSECMVEFNPEA